MVEALSYKEALTLLSVGDLGMVEVETNCQSLVSAVKDATSFFLSHGLILQDCQKLLEILPQVCFRFVRRSSNSIAHPLDRATLSVSNCRECLSSSPDFIQEALFQDVSRVYSLFVKN